MWNVNFIMHLAIYYPLFYDISGNFEWIWHEGRRNLKNPWELNRIVNTFLKRLAPYVLTKAYPAIPLSANSKLVTQSLKKSK
jgi:hypothetical protein